MDRLDMMRCFVAVAEQGSFAGAARKLGMSTSALTRHVAGLEADLSTRLLRRTTRAVSLTDEGSRFIDRARSILADFDDARVALEGDGKALTGKLVVTAPVIFGRMHVAPLLGEFALVHPQLQIELQVSDRFESLVEDGIDVAIRIGRLADSSDVAVKVGEVRRVLVGSLDYMAFAPPLEMPEDLVAHRLISLRTLTPAGLWTFFPKDRAVTIRPSAAFATNSAEVAIEYANRAGGLTFALSYQVFEHLKSGRLLRLLRDFEPPATPVSFVTSGEPQISTRVRALLDLIRKRAAWDFALTEAL